MGDTPNKQKASEKKPSKVKRLNISLPPASELIALVLGNKYFGSKSAYLAHLLVEDMKSHGLTEQDIIRLAKEQETDSNDRGETAP